MPIQYHTRGQIPIVTHTTNPQVSSPAPTTPPSTPTPELPFAIRKSTHSSRNWNSLYVFTINYDRLSPSYFSFVSSLDSMSIPKSTVEAMVDLGWRQAMVEMVALHSNGRWELVPLPLGKQIVGCHWFYTVKIGPKGIYRFFV